MLRSPIPENAEKLSVRIKMYGVSWEYTRSEYPSKQVLLKLAADDWRDHVDWVLGPMVYSTVVRSSDGKMEYSPAWLTILELEYQVRKEAMFLANTTDASLVEALGLARSGDALFQCFFQNSHSTRSRSRSSSGRSSFFKFVPCAALVA